jgi:hypothetical protein
LRASRSTATTARPPRRRRPRSTFRGRRCGAGRGRASGAWSGASGGVPSSTSSTRRPSAINARACSSLAHDLMATQRLGRRAMGESEGEPRRGGCGHHRPLGAGVGRRGVEKGGGVAVQWRLRDVRDEAGAARRCGITL